MDYELAKELKNVGFPQMGDGKALVLHSADMFEDEGEQSMAVISWERYVLIAPEFKDREVFYWPTLSEIIEACGDNFYQLVRNDEEYESKVWGWYASQHTGMGGQTDGGKTPEIALARLWLLMRRSGTI